MNAKRVLRFLRDIAANNNKQWFQDNKEEYLLIKEEFENAVAEAIAYISYFDPSIARLDVKDVTYRFYRDTRFSSDKSPYKRHLGAYIAAHGKKSFHGGYYIHIEPNNCFLACGSYWLPTNILTSCRNEIMANTEEWLNCVESKEFLDYFGGNDNSLITDKQGFGLNRLKTCPSGFPRDYKYINYLRMKDYCCWHHVSDGFFDGDDWLSEMGSVFCAARPMLDFVNSVVDDYE